MNEIEILFENEKSIDKELVVKIVVKNSNEDNIYYKFFYGSDGIWETIKDFSKENTALWVPEKKGKYAIMVQCKFEGSTKPFDFLARDEYIVGDSENYKDKVEIIDFKTLTKELICGEELMFEVKCIHDQNQTIEYKFIKIDEFGDKTVIEECTSSRVVYFKEDFEGSFKLLCLARTTNSLNEYDDRALINYKVKKKTFKPVEINKVIINKKSPFLVDETINLTAEINGENEALFCFIVKRGSSVLEEAEFSQCNFVNFTPIEEGDYTIEVMARDKDSNALYDSNYIIEINVIKFIPAKIAYVLLPLKNNLLTGRKIYIDVIAENTKKTYIKYSIKINDEVEYERDYEEDKNICFVPKISGSYLISIYGKNINSDNEFDDEKHLEIEVSDAEPISNTKIYSECEEYKVGVPIIFKGSFEGGIYGVFEFYVFEQDDWKLSQKYSSKPTFEYTPLDNGIHKLLMLTKNNGDNETYQDYDIIEFEVT